MVKVDKLVKFHIIPKDNAAKAERMESWEDVKAQIIADPPKVETQATWADATQSVGGFKRLVKQKVLRRGKHLPKAESAQSEPSEDSRADLSDRPLPPDPSGESLPELSEERPLARPAEHY